MRRALTLSGSIRQGSYNGQLAQVMADKLNEAGAEANFVDLAEHSLPLFNADLEKVQGEPETAIVLARLFAEADIIFIASPEYNGSLSPMLKNTLDWISRQKMKSYKNAIFGVGAASTGKMAGVGGLGHLRDILGKLGALVAPVALGVGMAATAFDEEGMLADAANDRRADALIHQLLNFSRSD